MDLRHSHTWDAFWAVKTADGSKDTPVSANDSVACNQWAYSHTFAWIKTDMKLNNWYFSNKGSGTCQ